MTGHAAGYCIGYSVPGYMNPIGGRGGGWGRRNWFYATGLTGWQRAGMGMPAYATAFGPAPTAPQELDMLKSQAEYFEDALEGIRKRIEELQAETTGKAE